MVASCQAPAKAVISGGAHDNLMRRLLLPFLFSNEEAGAQGGGDICGATQLVRGRILFKPSLPDPASAWALLRLSCQSG